MSNIPRIEKWPEMPNQTAKQDKDKPQLTMVDTTLIKAAAEIERYQKDADDRIKPELLHKTERRKGSWYGLFKCPYCEKEFEACISNVVRGRQHSCGCMKGKFLVQSKGTHGGTGTRLFRTYLHIKERCEKPYCKEYEWYGARGIKCEFESFEEFRDFALANGYSDNLTVERINVNGNYSKDNITFIPRQWQTRNTRRNVMLTYKGLTLCAAEWAEMFGFRPDTLTKRKRSGWSDAKTLETPCGDSIDITLIPIGAINAIRKVRLYGLKKYKSPNNWKSVESQRFWDATVRHIVAAWADYKAIDPESGLPHIYHAMCNLAFLAERMEREDEQS